ncbi:probable polygalacturonase At1g80170 [Humulus lupulus]|uniref:probable polygalacturonase At1g80170 n=1 Tax=Humulus lupulus TaxID=3486 RepID=UPI002B406B7A|nr:probable polygalacturonase At1g80170 [Humulus lupulus]
MATSSVANILNYGAAGDGVTDDSLAFLKAWNATCNSVTDYSTLLVPSGHTFLVQPLTFNGPCKSPNLYFQVDGGIVAPQGPNEWKANENLMSFVEVDGLSLNGTATIDGRGKPWWDASCRDHPQLQGCFGRMPTMVMFLHCTRVRMQHLFLVNSPQAHILVWNSDSVEFHFLSINSPADSPNTDGIHIQASTNVSILQSVIKAGLHFNLFSLHNKSCDIIHSIGSLGKDGSVANVTNIKVHHVKFFGTSNGARIKTYQVGKGIVQHVEFRNLTFYDVQNPIIIDQHYCFDPKGCQDLPTAVHIDDVSYAGAVGTSASEVAMNLNCSKTVPCTNISFKEIQLKPSKSLKSVESSCNNAHGSTTGNVKPASCLHG